MKEFFSKLYFIDYGTSLCPLSTRIRIRNSDKYNHMESVSNEALSLIHEPDFYYDDISHLGINGIATNNTNFLVAKNNTVYVKLGAKIYKYKLQRKKADSNVFLLFREGKKSSQIAIASCGRKVYSKTLYS